MQSTKNEQERTKYTQLIVQKEEEMAARTNDKRKIEALIQTLEENLHNGFQTLTRLGEEVVYFGGSEMNGQWHHEEERRHTFQQMLQKSNEQLENAYRNETRRLDEERESLYQKRGAIPWD